VIVFISQPACYAPTRQSVQSNRTYPYEGVLSRPYEGHGIAYPPYVEPGNVVQRTNHSVGQPDSPGGNNGKKIAFINALREKLVLFGTTAT